MEMRPLAGPVNEKQLFHGTVDDMAVVRGICHNNVDFRLSGKNGTVYGEGAYFARDAKYSHSYTRGPVRFMFLSKVLVGQYARGQSSYKRPPAKAGHALYDSCVDDVTNPQIYVIFEMAQSYPEFLVEYELTPVPAASLGPSPVYPSATSPGYPSARTPGYASARTPAYPPPSTVRHSAASTSRTTSSGQASSSATSSKPATSGRTSGCTLQ